MHYGAFPGIRIRQKKLHLHLVQFGMFCILLVRGGYFYL